MSCVGDFLATQRDDPQVPKREVRPVLLTGIAFEQNNVDKNLISLKAVGCSDLPFLRAGWVTTRLQLRQDL